MSSYRRARGGAWRAGGAIRARSCTPVACTRHGASTSPRALETAPCSCRCVCVPRAVSPPASPPVRVARLARHPGRARYPPSPPSPAMASYQGVCAVATSTTQIVWPLLSPVSPLVAASVGIAGSVVALASTFYFTNAVSRQPRGLGYPGLGARTRPARRCCDGAASRHLTASTRGACGACGTRVERPGSALQLRARESCIADGHAMNSLHPLGHARGPRPTRRCSPRSRATAR